MSMLLSNYPRMIFITCNFSIEVLCVIRRGNNLHVNQITLSSSQQQSKWSPCKFYGLHRCYEKCVIQLPRSYVTTLIPNHVTIFNTITKIWNYNPHMSAYVLFLRCVFCSGFTRTSHSNHQTHVRSWLVMIKDDPQYT